MDFFDLVKVRKSVRKYIDKPVEAEKVEKIFEAARLAPSWKNKQCWKFIVVTDPDKKKELIRCTGTFNQSWLGKEHAIIVACGDPERSGSRDGQHYYMVDVAIAMEHLVLAATSLGLGTCWIGYFDEPKMKHVLGIPDNYRVVAITPLGYPAEREGVVGKIARSVIKSKKRKPLSDVFCMNDWK